MPQDGITKTMRTKLSFRIYKLVVSPRISRMVRFTPLIPEERYIYQFDISNKFSTTARSPLLHFHTQSCSDNFGPIKDFQQIQLANRKLYILLSWGQAGIHYTQSNYKPKDKYRSKSVCQWGSNAVCALF